MGSAGGAPEEAPAAGSAPATEPPLPPEGSEEPAPSSTPASPTGSSALPPAASPLGGTGAERTSTTTSSPSGQRRLAPLHGGHQGLERPDRIVSQGGEPRKVAVLDHQRLSVEGEPVAAFAGIRPEGERQRLRPGVEPVGVGHVLGQPDHVAVDGDRGSRTDHLPGSLEIPRIVEAQPPVPGEDGRHCQHQHGHDEREDARPQPALPSCSPPRRPPPVGTLAPGHRRTCGLSVRCGFPAHRTAPFAQRVQENARRFPAR